MLSDKKIASLCELFEEMLDLLTVFTEDDFPKIREWIQRSLIEPDSSGLKGQDWVLVPRNATKEMKDAVDMVPGPMTGYKAWEVMVEAAPISPQSEKLREAFNIAVRALCQISETPRNRGAKRNAGATLAFLESLGIEMRPPGVAPEGVE